MNPQTRVVKSEEPANTLLLLRLEAASLTAETARHAAGGVVAYSGLHAPGVHREQLDR